MTDTIRKVSIEVDVINGKMQLGPVDTSPIMAAIKQVREEFKTMFGGVRANAQPVSSINTAIGDVQSSVSQAANDPQATQRSIGAGGRSGLHLPGYGQSVRDRAAEEARNAIEQMKAAGIGAELSEQEWEKVHDQLSKKAAVMVREHDREAQNGRRASDRAIMERDRQQKETEKFARRQTVAEEKEYDRQTNEALRSYSRIMRDRKQQSEAAAQAEDNANFGVIRLGKGIAQLGAASGAIDSDLMSAIVGIEAFGNITTAAATSLGVMGVVLASVGTAIVAHEVIMKKASDINQQYWRDMIADSQRATQATQAGFHFQSAMAMEMSQNMPNRTRSRTAWSDMFFRNKTEGDFAKIDARSYADVTPEQKNELRRRAAFDNQSWAQYDAGQDRANFLGKQLDALKSNPIDLDKAKVQIRSQFTAQRRVMSQAIDDIRNNPNRDFMGYKAWTKGQNEEAFRLDEGIKQSRADEAMAIKQVQDQYNALKQRELDINQQITQVMGEQHKTLKDMRQDAISSVRKEQEAIRAGNIQYGMSSEGDKLQERELQKKHIRIKDQLEQQAAGKNVEVERYNLHEIGVGQRSGNIALRTIRMQAERDAARDGIQKDAANQDSLKEATDRMAAIEKMIQSKIGNKEAAINGAEKTDDQLAADIVEGIKKAIPLQEFAAKIMRELAALEQQHRSWMLLNSPLTPR